MACRASPDDMFAWISDVNNLPHYLPPIKSADLEHGGDRLWLRGEIPGQGEFENKGCFRVHEQERRMEWGAEVYRDYSGELSVSENGGGKSAVTVRLRFGPQTVEGEIQEQSDEGRDPLAESVDRTLESIKQQIEEGAGKEPQPSPQN